MNYHTPVLLQEAIEFLDVKEDGLYIDATLGGGGHTWEIVKRGGRVLAIDVDEEAIKFVQEKLQETNGKAQLVRGNFRDIEEIASKVDFLHIDGILFDLGVSSHQFDIKERGFSFQKEAPLDMRMDQRLGVTAADLVNGLTKKELYELFNRLGEERYARTISESIISARGVKPITTTGELARIVERTVRHKGPKDINEATRVFQALRIAVNDELHAIREALPKAFELLNKDGRMVVISFHSLEDRIVKNEFKKLEAEGKVEILTEKPVVPSSAEIESNRRARSAKLRAIRKI